MINAILSLILLSIVVWVLWLARRTFSNTKYMGANVLQVVEKGVTDVERLRSKFYIEYDRYFLGIKFFKFKSAFYEEDCYMGDCYKTTIYKDSVNDIIESFNAHVESVVRSRKSKVIKTVDNG